MPATSNIEGKYIVSTTIASKRVEFTKPIILRRQLHSSSLSMLKAERCKSHQVSVIDLKKIVHKEHNMISDIICDDLHD